MQKSCQRTSLKKSDFLLVTSALTNNIFNSCVLLRTVGNEETTVKVDHDDATVCSLLMEKSLS
jgi:hypothetical protein